MEYEMEFSMRWLCRRREKKELLKITERALLQEDISVIEHIPVVQLCSRQPLAKTPSQWKPRISVILGSVALQSFDPPQLFGPCTLQQCTAIFVWEVLKRKHALFQFRTIPGRLSGKNPWTLAIKGSEFQNENILLVVLLLLRFQRDVPCWISPCLCFPFLMNCGLHHLRSMGQLVSRESKCLSWVKHKSVACLPTQLCL